MEQELIQRNLALQEEVNLTIDFWVLNFFQEYYRQQEEKYHRHQELQESLQKLARDKKNKQNEEKARKAAEKFHVDKGYARHKKILEEQKQIKRVWILKGLFLVNFSLGSRFWSSTRNEEATSW